MLKNPAEYKRDTSSAKFMAISRQVSSVTLPSVSAGYCLNALVNKSGMIRTQMGKAQYIRNGLSARDALCYAIPQQ
jgi:hypothetical protein